MRSAIAQFEQLLRDHTEALLQRQSQLPQRVQEQGKGCEFEEAWNSFQHCLRHSMIAADQEHSGPGKDYMRPVIADSQDELLLRREAQKGKKNRML